MSPAGGPVRLEARDGLATLRLAGVHGNAINDDLLDGIESALGSARADESIRGLLLASAGKIFCPGLDLQVLTGYDRPAMEAFLVKFSRCMLALYTFPKPVVAALGGHAIAGGCVVAMTADRRVLRRGALIGLNEIKVGVPLPWGVAQVMREGVPASRLEEVCLRGLNYSDEEALATGLAHELMDEQGFEAMAMARLAELSGKDLRSYALTKEYLRQTTVSRIREGEEAHRDEFLDCWFSPPTRARIEAIVAGLQGRSK